MVPEAASESEGSVVFEVVSLPFRRLWSYTVFAHSCEEHPLTEAMELGKAINEYVCTI